MNRFMTRIAYLGWLGAGNLGDEGCFQLFRDVVRARAPEIAVVPITIRESQGALFSYQSDVGPASRTSWRPSTFDFVVLGGGSLLHADRYIKALHTAQNADVPTAVWGTGCDRFPRSWAYHFLKRLTQKTQVARSQTAPPAITNPNPMLKKVLANCHAVGVRGPLTAGWLRAHGCGPVAVSGDPGMILSRPPNPKTSGPIRNRLCPKHVAVIWGRSAAASHQGISHDALTRRVADWLTSVANDFRIHIGTMWSHDIGAARELAEAVGNRAEFLAEPLTLDALQDLMSRVAGTVSYRLHGCIFSAACGVPFFSVAYRPKCHDFALSLGMGEFAVDPATPELHARLDNWIAAVRGHHTLGIRNQLRNQFEEKVKNYSFLVTGLAQQVIDELEGS